MEIINNSIVSPLSIAKDPVSGGGGNGNGNCVAYVAGSVCNKKDTCLFYINK